MLFVMPNNCTNPGPDYTIMHSMRRFMPDVFNINQKLHFLQRRYLPVQLGLLLQLSDRVCIKGVHKDMWTKTVKQHIFLSNLIRRFCSFCDFTLWKSYVPRDVVRDGPNSSCEYLLLCFLDRLLHGHVLFWSLLGNRTCYLIFYHSNCCSGIVNFHKCWISGILEMLIRLRFRILLLERSWLGQLKNSQSNYCWLTDKFHFLSFHLQSVVPQGIF